MQFKSSWVVWILTNSPKCPFELAVFVLYKKLFSSSSPESVRFNAINIISVKGHLANVVL